MPRRVVNPQLRNRVAAAVAVAGGTLTRAQIAAQFADCGVARSTIFSWIERAITDRALTVAQRQRPAAEPVQRQAAERATIGATAMLPPAAPVIPFQDLLFAGIQDGLAVAAMGKKADGSVRSPTMVLAAREQIRRHVATGAQVQHALRDIEAQRAFLRAVVDAIRQEPDETRDRILGRLRAVTANLGAI